MIERVPTTKSIYKTLPPRAKEALILSACGDTNKKISRKLGISLKTVEKHIQNGYDFLGIHNKVTLVHYALTEGWIRNLYDEN